MSTLGDSHREFEFGQQGQTKKRMGRRLSAAFAAAEHEGLELAVKGRTAAMLAIAVLLVFVTPYPGMLYYHGLLAIFIALGLARLKLQRSVWNRPWQVYALITIDFALLTFTLLSPNPLAVHELPPQLAFRFGNFVYFYVMLAGLAFSYRPAQVIWGGISGAICWGLAVAWLVSLPDTTTGIPEAEGLSAILATIGQPTFIDLNGRLQEIVVFLIVSGLLAVMVVRARRLVGRQASLERERSNLARYFSPATIDILAGKGPPLSEVREHKAAVLFADIVGFTAWAERHSPRETIEMLREAHGRMEEIVFRHNGAVDKFIGDGMMATFGTPEPGTRDAANGILCIKAILASIETWNQARLVKGARPIEVSLGLHYGPVVVGDIGTERRLEFAVLGDTVNVASRLEALTRIVACRSLVSGDAVEAAKRETPADLPFLLENLAEHGPVELKGRAEQVVAWKL